MIPILYESIEQDFKTNGLGRLPEATECTVTEERNGAYELEMQLPMTARHFAEIENERIILAKPNAISEPQPFEIYDITKPIGGIVTVNAKHISYRLSDIPCKPFSASTAAGTLAGLKNNAMEDCPFSFWTDKETAANYKQTMPASIRERLGGVAGSVLDCYGGEYEFDGWTVKLWNRRGADRGVTIRYGKNLIDAKQEQSIAGTSTGIIGCWTNEDGDCIYTDIIYSDNAGSFSHHKTRVVDFSSDFQEKPTAEQLTARVRTYIAANNVGVPETTINVSFIDLADTEEYKNLTRELIGLCDTVTVFYEKLGINTAAKVTKTEYDVLRERYNIIALGTYYSLASTVAGISSNVAGIKTETLSALAKAKASATAQITGADGGYVRTNLDADGNPYEILIMDEPDIETATEVWRWNKEGLGHSSTGYNGEYSTAITADGHIVADFMDTGTLTANLIKAGILTDEKGLNSWNMETGEFSLSSTTKVGDSTVASASDLSDYYTKTEIDVKENGITSTVSKKLDSSEFSTKLRQDATSVQIAWNNISKYIQFEDAELRIYDSADTSGQKLRSKFNAEGEHFYRDGYYVGKIGTNQWSGNSAHKGLVFDLDTQGKYMAFAQRESTSASGYTTMLCFSRASSIYDDYGMHLGCNLYGHNFALTDINLKSGISADGYTTATGSYPVVTSIENNSDGSITWKYGDVIVKNGLITSWPT